MHVGAFRLQCLGLAENCFRFLESVQVDEGDANVNVGARVFRIQLDGLIALSHRPLKRPDDGVFTRQLVQRLPVARIGTLPRFQLFDLLLPLTADSAVETRPDKKFFALTDAVNQFVSLRVFCARRFELVIVVIALSQPGMRDRKIWIALNREFIKGNRTLVIEF